MSELDDLVHRADLDGLVRLVDTLCATRDWSTLLELSAGVNTADGQVVNPAVAARSDSESAPLADALPD